MTTQTIINPITPISPLAPALDFTLQKSFCGFSIRNGIRYRLINQFQKLKDEGERQSNKYNMNSSISNNYFYLQNYQNIIQSLIIGWVSVIAMQPLDMIKTTMQTSQKKYTITECVKQIYSRSQLKGFYNGMMFPLIGSTFFSSIFYGSNEQIKKIFYHLSNKSERSNLSLTQIFLAGSFAGIMPSFMSIPMEHIKIRLQTQKTQMYHGSIDCFQKILKNHGIRGLYKSSSLQFLREFIGCGTFFVMYDVSKRYFKEQNGGQLDQFRLFLSGCVAGMSYWPLVFPLDVLKSKMQSDSFHQPQYLNTRDCAIQIYKQENRGLRNFYKGFLISNLRTIPNSALALFTFEYFNEFFSKKFGILRQQY